MKKEIAQLFDRRWLPGLPVNLARERGLLLLTVKDGVAWIGMRPPASEEEWRKRGLLEIVDRLFYETQASRVELVEVDDLDFEELLQLTCSDPPG